MAKLSVLDIVQEVLNDTDGDFVNSISDTDEAEQVASIVASTYRAMLSNRNWPHTNRTLTLTPSTDNLLPTHMVLPPNVKELLSIFYDKASLDNPLVQYREVKWKEPDDFLRFVFARNSTADNVETIVDPTGVRLLIMKDKAPDYYTSFDDNTLVFDSYDAEVDSTLQSTKTIARGYVIPEFIVSDDFIPDLPEEAFSALVEEVKSRASLKLGQKEDVKSEQEARKQNRWLARRDWRVSGGVRYPNYGRKKNVYRNPDPTFRKD